MAMQSVWAGCKALTRAPVRLFSTTRAVAMDGYQDDKVHKIYLKRVIIYNKRHLPEHKKELFLQFERPNKYPDIRIHKYGCRGTGIRHAAAWQAVPEMVPELIVPNLEGCKLKPYVSYRTKDIQQEELTAKDLFNAVYGRKMVKDFRESKLEADGAPKEPSDAEKQTADEAYVKARKTGSDIFLGGAPRSKLWNVRWEY